MVELPKGGTALRQRSPLEENFRAMTKVAARWSLVNVSIATHHDREAYLLGESPSWVLHSPQSLEDCNCKSFPVCTRRSTKRRSGACVGTRVRGIVSFGICFVLTVLLVVRSRSPFEAEMHTDHVACLHCTFGTWHDNSRSAQTAGCCEKIENGGCLLPSCWPWPDALIAITLI
jgi:hypothetical protein